MRIKLKNPLTVEIVHDEIVVLEAAGTELDVHSDQGNYWLAWQGINVYAVPKDDAEIVEQ